jgi:hypothetical protein
MDWEERILSRPLFLGLREEERDLIVGDRFAVNPSLDFTEADWTSCSSGRSSVSAMCPIPPNPSSRHVI